MNNKGDVTDIMSFLIMVVILGIGLFVMAFTTTTISTKLTEANLNTSVEGTNAIDKLGDYGLNGIQKGFFLLFCGLLIAELISAFYSDTHPIWLFLYIIILAVTLILGAYLGNLYDTITSLAAFSGFSQGLIGTVMHNLLKITLGVSALSMIIAFSKWAYNPGVRV